MSLLVWLPLDGKMNNYGADNVTNLALGTGNSWVSDGKVTAQCAHFTKGTDYLNIPKIVGAKQMTVAYWVKVNNTWTKDWYDGFRWQSTDGTTNVYSRQEFYNNCTTVGFWYANGSGSGTSANSALSFTPGVWTHFAFTIDYNTGKTQFYINGILKKSTSTVGKTHYINGAYIALGERNGGTIDINMNDFRLYNHILTAAEIKEIARGMVVHYKLDGGLFGNPNIITSYDTSFKSYADGAITLFTNQMNSGTQEIVSNVNGAKKCLHLASKGGNNRQYKTSGGTSGITYTFSLDYFSPTSQSAPLRLELNGNNYSWAHVADSKNYTAGSGWQRLSVSTPKLTSNTTIYYFIYCANGTECYVKNIKIERAEASTPWCPSTSSIPYITDDSGYKHLGTITGVIPYSAPAPRYNNCINITQGTTNNIRTTGLNLPQFPLTACIWFKSTNKAPTGDYHQPFTLRSADNTKSIGIFVYKTGPFRGGVTANGANSWANVNGTNALDGKWHFCAITYDGETLKKYFDGELGASTAVANTGDAAILDSLYIGSYPSQYGCVDTYLSDFRLYSTVLLDTDIKMLYNTSMRIDKNHNVHTFQALQTRENLFARAEIARAAGKGFKTSVGLYRYIQDNCQVTCDERGLRIYRPPDLAAGSGNKTFGGLVLRNSTNTGIHVYNPERDNIFGLINGHTYIWAMTISGHTHSVPTFTINNNTGYASNATRGLNTAPTNVKQHNIPADFDGTQEVFYKFTISDTIVKTCKQSYSSFVEGNDYLAYMDFAWRWDYLATGEQGTEIYVSNLRLYDITDMPDFTIGKDGIVRAQDFIEAGYGTKIQFDSELLANEIIER